ncbi:MAG: alpha/beta hydrolase [Cohaesibacter sp.]|jgi:acetyl esterase|nr:alpha/beta hydrolase [Cohaesibacter sp.]
MDQDILTDPEILAFVKATDAAYPPEANSASPAENRTFYDAMCTRFKAPRPEGLKVRDAHIGSVPVRFYHPQESAQEGAQDPADRPFLLYAHGGGFVVGSLDSHDDICAELSARCSLELVAVDYRLSPEHVYPAALEDVAAVWQHMARTGRRGLVMGDSAGANLVAALCHRLYRQSARGPLGQVLVYPALAGPKSAGSIESRTLHAHAPMLSSADIDHYLALYLGPEGMTAGRANDPEVSPLEAEDLSFMPQALIVTADIDPLRDDGKLYAQRLMDAGVAATWRNEPQLVHGYLRARHTSRRARQSFEAMVTALCQMAG